MNSFGISELIQKDIADLTLISLEKRIHQG